MKTKTVNTTPGKYKYVTTGGETFTFKPKRLPRCHDCGVKVGEFHEVGCDVEECDNCHSQLISCGHAGMTPRGVPYGKERRANFVGVSKPTTSKENWEERLEKMWVADVDGSVWFAPNELKAFIQSELDQARVEELDKVFKKGNRPDITKDELLIWINNKIVDLKKGAK
jgi:hypothetical protein